MWLPEHGQTVHYEIKQEDIDLAFLLIKQKGPSFQCTHCVVGYILNKTHEVSSPREDFGFHAWHGQAVFKESKYCIRFGTGLPLKVRELISAFDYSPAGVRPLSFDLTWEKVNERTV